MIPIVDLSDYNRETKRAADVTINQLADQIYHAFATVGFVYIKNHGIQQAIVICQTWLNIMYRWNQTFKKQLHPILLQHLHLNFHFDRQITHF